MIDPVVLRTPTDKRPKMTNAVPRHLSNFVLIELLRRASHEELDGLRKTLGVSEPLRTPEELQVAICECGGHSVANWLRVGGTAYIDMVDDVVQLLKIPGLPEYTGHLDRIDDIFFIKSRGADAAKCAREGHDYTCLAERKIVLELVGASYDGLSPEKKREFDEQVREVAAKHGKDLRGVAGAAGVMAVGELGGFATFTMASSVLKVVSLGLLPFGAYTAVSSILGVVLGPVGWTAMGLTAIYRFGKPNMQKVVSLVAQIGAIRQRVVYGNDGQAEVLMGKLVSYARTAGKPAALPPVKRP